MTAARLIFSLCHIVLVYIILQYIALHYSDTNIPFHLATDFMYIFFLFISEKRILFCKSFFFAIRGLDPWVPHGSIFLSTTVKLALDTAEENKK